MRESGTAVLIDAGYLSVLSKHFGEGTHLKLDVMQFSKHLARKNKLWLKELYYYTAPPYQGTPPSEDEAKRKKGYDKFVAKIKKFPGVTVREGRLQKIGRTYTQKGVDTLVVMDLVRLAESNTYNNIILLACDTDFVPVLKKIYEDTKVNVILCYYTDRVRGSKFSLSNELLSVSRNKLKLSKEDFLDSSAKK